MRSTGRGIFCTGVILLGKISLGRIAPRLEIPKLPTASRIPCVQAHAPSRVYASTSPQRHKSHGSRNNVVYLRSGLSNGAQKLQHRMLGDPQYAVIGVFTALSTPPIFAWGKLPPSLNTKISHVVIPAQKYRPPLPLQRSVNEVQLTSARRRQPTPRQQWGHGGRAWWEGGEPAVWLGPSCWALRSHPLPPCPSKVLAIAMQCNAWPLPVTCTCSVGVVGRGRDPWKRVFCTDDKEVRLFRNVILAGQRESSCQARNPLFPLPSRRRQVHFTIYPPPPPRLCSCF